MPGNRGYCIRHALPGIVVLTILFLIPLAATFSYAFRDEAKALIGVVRDGYTYRLLSFTLTQSLLSALIAVAAALPFAAFFARYSFPGRKAVMTLSALSFTIPTILVVLGFVIWYGNNGILNTLLMKLLHRDYTMLRVLYSFKAIILAHVYLNFPVAFLLITEAWMGLPDTAENAAYTLGASRMKAFLSVTLPRLRGGIASAFVLIFLFCFSSFSIILVLGGNPAYSTFETEIYRKVHISVDREGAAALSVFALCVTAILMAAAGLGVRQKRAERHRRTLRKAEGGKIAEAIIMMLLMLLFLLPPILSILYRAFFTKDGAFTLRAWEDIAGKGFGMASTALEGIMCSFAIAAAVSILSIIIGLRIAEASAKCSPRLLPAISSLPMAAGSVTLGLGFSFISALIPVKSDLISCILVAAAHLVIVLPFSVRTMTPGARAIPERITQAAYTLGASAGKARRKAELPLLAPYIRKAAAFSFALSLGEVNATLTLSDGRITTIPVLIYRMISSYNYQGAAALGTILLAMALIIFAIGEYGGKDNGIS